MNNSRPNRPLLYAWSRLLALTMLLVMSSTTASADVGAIARYEQRLQQAAALEAGAAKRCAHQPAPARPACYADIAGAAARMRKQAASERDNDVTSSN